MHRLILLFLLATLAGFAAESPISWNVNDAGTTGMVLTVTNRGQSPITGMCFKTNMYIDGKLKGAAYLYFDSTVNVEKDIPIKPGESRAYTLAAETKEAESRVQRRIDEGGPAVLLADGTSYGNETLSAILKGRRQVVLEDLQRYLPAIDRLTRSPSEVEAVLSQLELGVSESRGMKPTSRIDAGVLLARGFVPNFLRVSVSSIAKSGCATDAGCADRHYRALKLRCEQWRERLTAGTQAGQN